MDLLVVSIILVAIAFLASTATRHGNRLGIVYHPANGDVNATAADAEEHLVDEAMQRSRRESEWQHWYQLGNS